VLVAAYLIEAGVLLVIAPWFGWLWDRNYFASALPWLGEWMASGYVRGAVTGVGLITVAAGLRDLVATFVGRTTAPAPVSRHDDHS